ncbi:MAG: HupE/UreJ family protein [Gammaproteobacteria bacterium]|nr:HupE/UreJ family protein [Gammaproteobacteria bacterium]MDD9959281.1 HupE/UreJ family protein [Gammaproteobacteria bacterium]
MAKKNINPVKLSIALLLCWPLGSLAHDVDVTGVARVLLYEQANNEYQLSIVDQQVPPLFNIERVLPDRCVSLEPTRFSYRFVCQPALNVQDTLLFPWSFEGVVVISQWADGSDVSSFFPGDGSFVEVPLSQLKAGAASLSTLAVTYLILGAEHILFGIDHLLFVLGLLLLLSGFWKLIKTITAFTIAHSITLAFAVLGIFPVPNAPIEVLIALSIVFLAREVIMGQKGELTLVHSKPWIVAFVFGLFHGFGFAGALGELGLSDSDIPLALLFFNLGVEGGQVAFICALLAINAFFIRFLNDLVPSMQRGLAYGLGGIAMFWFLERIPALVIA